HPGVLRPHAAVADGDDRRLDASLAQLGQQVGRAEDGLPADDGAGQGRGRIDEPNRLVLARLAQDVEYHLPVAARTDDDDFHGHVCSPLLNFTTNPDRFVTTSKPCHCISSRSNLDYSQPTLSYHHDRRCSHWKWTNLAGQPPAGLCPVP